MFKVKHMRSILSIAPILALIFSASSYAINAEYAKQLDRSGCTQITELQGCDIRKSKSENAKVATAKQADLALTSAPTMVSYSANGSSPYMGNWIAAGANGAMVRWYLYTGPLPTMSKATVASKTKAPGMTGMQKPMAQSIVNESAVKWQYLELCEFFWSVRATRGMIG